MNGTGSAVGNWPEPAAGILTMPIPLKKPGYELVNLKLGLESTHWDGYVWSKNLFDRHYCIFENVDRGITEDGEPLTIGITLSYRF